MPTVEYLLKQARFFLTQSGSTTPSLDARLIVQDAMALDHAAVIAEPERAASASEVSRIDYLLKRRCDGEPLSRLFGVREFYGVDFKVTPAVLDPRPDTEHLAHAALNSGRGLPEGNYTYLDLGTGSGAVAIIVALQQPGARVVAIDVSAAALEVARENAVAHGVDDRIAFMQSDWFSKVEGKFNVIVSNPPYIPTGDIADLARDVKDYDPVLALDGGTDGLACYRRIAAEAAQHLFANGVVIVEFGSGQADAVSAIFKRHGFRINYAYADLAGLTRGIAFDMLDQPDN